MKGASAAAALLGLLALAGCSTQAPDPAATQAAASSGEAESIDMPVYTDLLEILTFTCRSSSGTDEYRTPWGAWWGTRGDDATQCEVEADESLLPVSLSAEEKEVARRARSNNSDTFAYLDSSEYVDEAFIGTVYNSCAERSPRALESVRSISDLHADLAYSTLKGMTELCPMHPDINLVEESIAARDAIT